MKIDYKNGKIYRLVDLTTGAYYIGATFSTLEKRLLECERRYKSYKNGKKEYNMVYFKIFENGNYEIELIEQYECQDKQHLRMGIGYWIRMMPQCINKRVPTRTQRQWCYENRKKQLKYTREYYYKNHERYLKRGEQRRMLNKGKISKQEISEYCRLRYMLNKYTCLCGVNTSRYKRKQHNKSQNHQRWDAMYGEGVRKWITNEKAWLRNQRIRYNEYLVKLLEEIKLIKKYFIEIEQFKSEAKSI